MPVLAGQTGGIPELIQHRKNGYLAKTGSATDLAEGIGWLLAQSPEQRVQLSQNARTFAEARFAESVVAGQYAQLYADVLAVSTNRT